MLLSFPEDPEQDHGTGRHRARWPAFSFVTYADRMRILVVDDHAPTRKLLERNLESASHGVKLAACCAQASAAAAMDRFDVIVLDVMLPDGCGIALCGKLRDAGIATPILLLTARGEVRDRVRGLGAGADDYLAKPFAVAELLARIHALGRRGPITRDRTVTIGALQIDLEARRVRVGGSVVPLTAKELAIVEVLTMRRGGTVTRSHLLESVWGDADEAAEASLEVLVARIRRKLGDAAPLLRTLRGIGYSLGAP
jgi:DNA-binding response OmpR family regulator